MPAETQDILTYTEDTENLYESAMVVAKRARQLNDELYQKKRDRQILDELEGGYDEELLMEEEESAEEEETVEWEENPIVTAQREYLEKQLEFHYEPVKK